MKRIWICIIAIVALALTAFASAEGEMPGVLDFIVRYGDKVLPQGAEELVERGVDWSADEDGEFALAFREGIFDGKNWYAVIDITPRDEGALLLNIDSSVDYPIADLVAGADGTIGEYCAANGYTSAWRVEPVFPGFDEGEAMQAACDGYLTGSVYTLYVMLEQKDATDTVTVDLPIRFTPFADVTKGDASDPSRMVEETIHFTLSGGGRQSVRSDAEYALSACGIAITGVDVTIGKLDCTVSVTYRITDEQLYAAQEDGLWLLPVDESGSEYPSGATGSGEIVLVSGEDGKVGTVYQETVNIFMESLPDSIRLLPRNCWDKTEYGIVAVPLA